MPSLPIFVPTSTTASSGPPPFVYFATAVGVGKVVGDALGYKAPEAVTGYQHTKAGGRYMDETLAILNDKERGEKALTPAERKDFIRQYDRLHEDRSRLEESTNSVLGSARNWYDGRTFHNKAHRLHTKTRRSSDEGISKNISALANMQANGDQAYRPSGYTHEPSRNQKRHDEGSHNANYPWASQDGRGPSYNRPTPHGYPHYPPPAAYGQSNQTHTQPTNSQARGASSDMSSSQWAQYTAANPNSWSTPSNQPSSKPRNWY